MRGLAGRGEGDAVPSSSEDESGGKVHPPLG